MSERVPADQIEAIVGVPRHQTEHYGRAVAAEQTVYVLHSQGCKDNLPDLRRCPYSLALDRGIDSSAPWAKWQKVQDRPVRLLIDGGYLMPGTTKDTS